MLDRLVRPLVRTQIKLLTQTQSASTRLMGMVSEWLGHLGVNANVTHLNTEQGKIRISLEVGKPEQCSEREWTKILENIEQDRGTANGIELTYAGMSADQQSKVHRLLASVIQAGDKNAAQSWDSSLHSTLATMGMNEEMLANIRSALKVPAILDSLLEDLEPEVAAFVLSKAISIALIDREINQDEDDVLKSIYSALENKAKVNV